MTVMGQDHASRASEVICRLLSDRHSAFAIDPARGTLRGIDVYSVRDLIRTLEKSLSSYERATGEPACDPEKALLLREKIFWSKFFRPMSIPTPADKLGAYAMLPAEIKQHVKEPSKIWHSTQPSLPLNGLVPAGAYYLKVNNSSHKYARVVYPVEENHRVALESKARRWVRQRYGWKWGEWWYSTIKPHVFMEKELPLPVDQPGEYKFYVVRGTVSHLHVKWPIAEGVATSLYDRDLCFMDITYKGRPSVRRKLPSAIADLASIAEDIGRTIDFVRVDLYLDRNGEVWFGELTFAPSNGVGRYSSREFEIECCKQWDFARYLYPQQPQAPISTVGNL